MKFTLSTLAARALPCWAILQVLLFLKMESICHRVIKFCTCKCAYMPVITCVHLCEGQRLTLGIFLNLLPLYFYFEDFLLFIYHYYESVCMIRYCVRVPESMCGDQKTITWSQFFLPLCAFWGSNLGRQACAASTFAFWMVLLAPHRLIICNRASHWMWSSLIWLEWASSSRDLPVSAFPALGWQVYHAPGFRTGSGYPSSSPGAYMADTSLTEPSPQPESLHCTAFHFLDSVSDSQMF